MNFKNWLSNISEGWILGEESKSDYKRWKSAIKTSSDFLRGFNWNDAKKIMERMNLTDYYSSLAKKEMGIPDSYSNDKFLGEWAAKMFIRDKSDMILAKVDPCKLMNLRTLSVTEPDSSWHEKGFSETDFDPLLPLLMVTPKGVLLYDGNHRMQAACKLGSPGYAAIAYFMNYDVVKSAILEILEA